MQGHLAERAAGEVPALSPSRDPEMETLLKSLRTAWQKGDVRPTHAVPPQSSRDGRTRVDPFEQPGLWSAAGGRLSPIEQPRSSSIVSGSHPPIHSQMGAANTPAAYPGVAYSAGQAAHSCHSQRGRICP